ncbi:MAG: ABC transporter substrate-binding protein, partial [Ferrovibrionaceae bacterium]
NDEAICQAVTAMLARVGVKVTLRAQTRLKYFAQILGPKYDTSFYMLGWTPATYDAHNAMQALMQTRDNKQIGLFNVGGWSNKKFDDLANTVAQELDQTKRDAMIKEAAIIHRDEVGHIPLHQQYVVWAARKNIDLKQQADNMFPLRFVKVN